MKPLSDILQFNNFYFVGIKGVAMTSLAQCLLDAGKVVRGSDVAEEFVTQPILNELKIPIDTSFLAEIPAEVECVVYTSAHQAKANPQVQAALTRRLPIFSQAEAIASLFNQKHGIAVCGVGGKSTTSAMIAWILAHTGRQPSYSVGVGSIPGLPRTGQWQTASPYFVAEADEYVINPGALAAGEKSVARFSFMTPFVTVCTNLRFDHPDVYRDFTHTKETFYEFFNQIKPGGSLLLNGHDRAVLTDLSTDATLHWFGEAEQDEFRLVRYSAANGETVGECIVQSVTENASSLPQSFTIKLQIPGKYNIMNALAAVAACSLVGVLPSESVAALATFRSTQRRAEFIGDKQGVKFYDDYAHHPNEVQSVLHAFREWFPSNRIIAAFQSHTFSRTKALFAEFSTAFSEADEVVMIDIFPSAREAYDETITSTLLCAEIQKVTGRKAANYKTLPELANYLKSTLQPGDVLITIGAGDIYHLHDLL